VLRLLRIVAAALAGAGLVGLAVAALAFGARREGTAATVTLQVAPRGLGTVSVDPPGQDGDGQPVSDCDRNIAQHSCLWGYAPGTRVTLTAHPDTATGRSFAGWSTPDCPGTGPCTVTLDDDLTTVVARFTPLRLGVKLSDSEAADLTTDPAGGACRQELHDTGADLCREFPAGTRVTVTVTPKDGHSFGAWNPGCDPVGANSCAITVLDEATWVGASLDGLPLPGLPTTISVRFRIGRAGDGSGRVTASKLDCGSDCRADYDYGTSLTLTAAPDAGSVFEGWGGACAATARTCTIPVGPITGIRARFGRSSAPPGPPASLTVTRRTPTSIRLSWSPPTDAAAVRGYGVYAGGAVSGRTTATRYTIKGLRCGRRYALAVDAVDAGGRRSTRVATTARTTACTVSAHLTGVRVKRSGRARAVIVRLRVDRAATIRLGLLSHGHAVAARRYRVARGPHRLRLGVPRRMAAGRYQLRVAVAARSGRTLELKQRTVRLPGIR
jgi:hypothetical protein